MANQHPHSDSVPETPEAARSEPARGEESNRIRQRLLALEAQIQAFRQQVEAQLNGMLSNLHATLAMLDGQAATGAPPAQAPPATTGHEAPSATARLVQVGTGQILTAAADDKVNLPHLLDPGSLPQPAAGETSSANSDDRDEQAERSVHAREEAPTVVDDVATDLGAPTVIDEPDNEQIVPDSGSLANLDSDQLKALLKRKSEAQLERDPGSLSSSSMRTRRLVLSPDELAELQREPRQSSTPPVSRTSRHAEPKRVSTQAPRRLPYPDEIDRIKRLMFTFKGAVHDIVDNQVIPGTTILISSEMRDELT